MLFNAKRNGSLPKQNEREKNNGSKQGKSKGENC